MSISSSVMQALQLRRSKAATQARWQGWLAGGVGLALWMFVLSLIAYRSLQPFSLTIGGYYDQPYLRAGFSDRELQQGTERPFRWTDGDALIVAPIVGGGAWNAALAISANHPDGDPVNARAIFGDGTTLALPDTVEPRVMHMFVPPSATADGSLAIRLLSDTYAETTASARELGVTLFGLQASPTTPASFLPPLTAWMWLALIVVAVFLTLGAAGLGSGLAAGLAAAIGGGLTIPLLLQKVPYTFWLSSLALFSAIVLLLTLFLRWLVPVLSRKAGVPIGEHSLTALLLLFVGSMWLKGGGQLFPYMIAIDVHWHMDRVRWILNGHLADMYKPGAFNESVMPVNEWGENRPTIPYSPFFHLFATSFAIFPWLLETTAKIFSTTIDSSRVVLIFLLARMFGLRERPAVLASALYCVFPATYLLHSWGNVPTTFGMWWTLVTSAFIIGAWGRLNQKKPFAILTAILLATFLIYTVMAVYMGMLLIIWMAWIAWRRPAERRQVWMVTLSIVAAFALSLAIYYGQYVADIITKTIPYFRQTLTEGQESVGATPFQETYSSYLYEYLPRLWRYGLLIPYILAPLGLWLLRPKSADPALVEPKLDQRWQGPVWLTAMFAIGLIFVPIARSVPMVDKNVFFVMPAAAITTAALIETALLKIKTPRGALALKLATAAIYGLLLYAAIDLWIYRIVTVKQTW